MACQPKSCKLYLLLPTRPYFSILIVRVVDMKPLLTLTGLLLSQVSKDFNLALMSSLPVNYQLYSEVCALLKRFTVRECVNWTDLFLVGFDRNSQIIFLYFLGEI